MAKSRENLLLVEKNGVKRHGSTANNAPAVTEDYAEDELAEVLRRAERVIQEFEADVEPSKPSSQIESGLGRGARKKDVRNKDQGITEELQMPDDDIDGVAGARMENRPFIKMNLGGKEYRALLDSGSEASVAGPKLAKDFRDRLRKASGGIQNVHGVVEKALGILETFEVEAHTAKLPIKVVKGITHDLILGMDWSDLFPDFEVKLTKRQWRMSEQSEWRPVENGQGNLGLTVFAKCIGISVMSEN